jgi:hypothetical protein
LTAQRGSAAVQSHNRGQGCTSPNLRLQYCLCWRLSVPSPSTKLPNLTSLPTSGGMTAVGTTHKTARRDGASKNNVDLIGTILKLEVGGTGNDGPQVQSVSARQTLCSQRASESWQTLTWTIKFLFLVALNLAPDRATKVVAHEGRGLRERDCYLKNSIRATTRAPCARSAPVIHMMMVVVVLARPISKSDFVTRLETSSSLSASVMARWYSRIGAGT